MQVVGEAGIRISALTKDLGRVIQRSVNNALSDLRAPKRNALTELQRELNRGELALAKASKARKDAQLAVSAAEKELAAIRKDGTASADALAAAEEKHKRSLIALRVATDDVNVAQEKFTALQERMRKGNIDTERSNARVGRTFQFLGKVVLGTLGGLSKAALTGTKVALIGVAAAGAVAGVTSLTIGTVALAGALAQAAGAAGLLPAVLAGKWAVVATAKLALTGFADAMKAVASGDAAAFNEALEGMAPNAQRFAREIRKVKPAFDEMRLDVQQRAFAGLSSSVGQLADRYLPVATGLFQGIAAAMNSAAKETIRFAMSGEALRNTQTTVGQLQASAHNLAPAFAPAVRAILNVVTVGSTFLPRLTQSFSEGIQGMSARITEMARSGELEAFFQRALNTISQLGRIASNVGQALSGIFRAAESGGGGFLANLEAMTASMSRFVNSVRGQQALSSFFAAMRAILAALMPVIQQVALILGGTLAPIIANIATAVLPALLPLLQAFGTLLAAASPLITVLAETLAMLMTALAPVIEMFAQALTEIMPQLLPVIMAIGEAFAQLITVAAPLAPLFLQIVTALLPIIPPILQLVSALLPPLIQLIQALMPVLTAFAAGFAATLPIMGQVAAFILSVLIPPIRLIAAVVSGAIQLSVAIFQAFANAVRTRVQQIIGFIGFIGQIIGKVAGFFQRMRDAAIQRAIALVNWVKGLPGRIIGAIGDLGAKLWNAGVQAIQGLLNGLKNAAGAVIDWVKGLAGDLVDSVLGVFGIASPSKVFRGIGENLGKGLVEGIQKITPDVVAAAAAMANRATANANMRPLLDVAMTSGLDRALSDAAAAGVPTGSDGAMTPEELAEAMAGKLGQLQVVVSSTELTSKVKRRTQDNARR